jgi:hypothetical protein
LNGNISQIETLYELVGRDEVLDYLDRYPFLSSLLLEAFGQVKRLFGPKPRVTLRVAYDPEATDECELVASIHTGLPVEEVVDRLDRFDNDWGLDAMEKAQGKLSFDLEFVA